MTSTKFEGNVPAYTKEAFLRGDYATSDGWQPSVIYATDEGVFASYEARPETSGGIGWTTQIG